MTKQKLSPEDERALDELAAQLQGVDPERVKALFIKTERVEIRVSKSDFQRIKDEAARRSLSVSEYLLDCHRVACGVQAPKSRYRKTK